MLRLSAVLGLVGLLVGFVSALILHSLPAGIVGFYNWAGYLPEALPPDGYKVSITLNWLPSVLWLSAAGLVLGVLAGVALGLAGMRVVSSCPQEISRPSR